LPFPFRGNTIGDPLQRQPQDRDDNTYGFLRPVEPVIVHLKDDHRMRRANLSGEIAKLTHAVFAAAGFKFSLHLR
jgi:hypothetical protein